MTKPLLTEEQTATVVAFLQKLNGLRINATIEKVEPGPVVTSYHFKLHNSVPLTKILNKAEDFALASGVEKVSIQRIGGEVVILAANKERKLVDFKDYLTWLVTDKEAKEYALPIALGVDTLGQKAALNLAVQPHLLLAGATGSGKSVFQSAIISCLTVAKLPSEMEIILVDTKQLDLPLFGSLPHIRDVVTKLGSFHNMGQDLLRLIYGRMETLRNLSVRNIQEYHKMQGNKTCMPYIVLIIDEFADLLEQDKAMRKAGVKEENDVGGLLQRIVQISRAAGVHVIAATQRTSVKVISGDIKANFPCRISLQLPTAMDSMTILGQGGAELLLGKGDMLVQTPSNETPRRYHGPFVNLNDIAWITAESEYVRDMLKGIQYGQ